MESAEPAILDASHRREESILLQLLQSLLFVPTNDQQSIGKLITNPNTMIAPPPQPLPPPTSLLDQHTWKQQGFKMVRGNRSRISMMKDWHRLMETGSGTFTGWTEMRAQFFEQDMRESLQCSLLEQQRVRVVSSAEILARELLHSLDVDHQSLRMSDIGCLRTDHNIGLQEIHADIQEFKYSHLCYIVIFYLVDTDSTAVANVGKDELDPVWKMSISQADGWEQLNHLTHEVDPPFVGDSVEFPHIFAVLQHLINTRNAFLNGDWPFINGILGLMSPSATHPCPICIITKNNLIHTSRYRNSNDQHSVDHTHSPLITINPERIVPTPLHLFLGISNRIILDALKELLGESIILEAVKSIKTVHSSGCGGLSDLYDLNGPEISKFIKKECSTKILTAAAATSSITDATKASHSVLTRWLKQLHRSLLHSNDWTAADIDAWRTAVSDIHSNWRSETSINAFPKLHMLHHTIDFAERHRFLGRVSEAQIESYHATFNSLFHKHHHNMSGNTGERLRRCLADATLQAVQPFVNS